MAGEAGALLRSGERAICASNNVFTAAVNVFTADVNVFTAAVCGVVAWYGRDRGGCRWQSERGGARGAKDGGAERWRGGDGAIRAWDVGSGGTTCSQ